MVMNYKKSKRGWTEESLKEEALKYGTRSEFSKNSHSAYVAASRKKMLGGLCQHMKTIRHKWTAEELREEALKYNTKLDFSKKSNDAYKAAWRRNILVDICSHMDVLWETKWLKIEEVEKEALKYKTRTEFARKSSGAYCRAQEMGWIDQVCLFMGEKSNESYSFNELKEIALKYKNKKELRKKNPGVYGAARNLKIADQIFNHFVTLWKKKWDKVEKIKEEALKYKTRGEFKKNSAGAWDAALNKKILNEVCSHMKKSKCSSLKELELYGNIKKIHASANKITDRKVSIPNKPHIFRFELDIYIPELRKGIEFDGKYWHSFEKMKIGRRNWPEADIRNYHEIKDSHFLSKGIEILHIKEEDWDLDKESCIKKCLEFLGESSA